MRFLPARKFQKPRALKKSKRRFGESIELLPIPKRAWKLADFQKEFGRARLFAEGVEHTRLVNYSLLTLQKIAKQAEREATRAGIQKTTAGAFLKVMETLVFRVNAAKARIARRKKTLF